jgi:hypothetical protein
MNGKELARLRELPVAEIKEYISKKMRGWAIVCILACSLVVTGLSARNQQQLVRALLAFLGDSKSHFESFWC